MKGEKHRKAKRHCGGRDQDTEGRSKISKWTGYKERDKKGQKEDGRNGRHEKDTYPVFIWIPYERKHSTNEMKQLFRDTVWEHFLERMNLPIEWAPGQGKLTHFGQHQKHSSKVIGLEQSDKKKRLSFFRD